MSQIEEGPLFGVHDADSKAQIHYRLNIICDETKDVGFLTFGQHTEAPRINAPDIIAKSDQKKLPDIYQSLKPFLHTAPFTQKFDKNPIVLFLDELLRGASQTIFQNNPFSGIMVLIGIGINSPVALVCAFLGLICSTLTAHILVVDAGARRNGVFGLSGILVGLVLSLFHFFSDSDFSTETWVLIPVALLSSLSCFVTVGVANIIIPSTGLAPLAVPFLICSYSWLLSCTGGSFSYFPIKGTFLQPTVLQNPTDFPNISLLDYQFVDLLKSFLINIGNCAFNGYEWTGLCFLIGAFIASPISAFMLSLGSILAIFYELAFGINQSYVLSGVLGFNTVLTTVALGGVFLILRGIRVWFSILAGSFLSFILTVGLTNFFTPMGLPVLGLPFSIAVWITILCARGVPTIYVMPLNLITTPENHILLSDELIKKQNDQKDPFLDV